MICNRYVPTVLNERALLLVETILSRCARYVFNNGSLGGKINVLIVDWMTDWLIDWIKCSFSNGKCMYLIVIYSREFDSWLRKIYISYFYFFALVFATQHATPPEFSRKWGAECLYSTLPLTTLLHIGYRVNEIYKGTFI